MRATFVAFALVTFAWNLSNQLQKFNTTVLAASVEVVDDGQVKSMLLIQGLPFFEITSSNELNRPNSPSSSSSSSNISSNSSSNISSNSSITSSNKVATKNQTNDRNNIININSLAKFHLGSKTDNHNNTIKHKTININNSKHSYFNTNNNKGDGTEQNSNHDEVNDIETNSAEVGIIPLTHNHQITKRHLAYQDPSTDCEPISSRPFIYGLRCDECHEVADDGAIVIKSDSETKIYLFGKNLYSNLSVALTPAEGSPQDDCTHTNRVKTLHITNINSRNIAELVVDMTIAGKMIPFYFCLREASEKAGWYHQGSNPWLKIYITKDLLPLFMKIIVIACLLMLSGLFSGLNLGLMALDKNELAVIISCGTETEKRYARAIEPVRRRGNFLLCSLLFSNVLVNSTISVLLEELTSGIVAVMTSTIFIVMFGEILPQAFCSRHGLAVGAKTVGITYLCMVLTWPLSYPVSFCLDWALGEEIGHVYDRDRLVEFIKVTQDYTNLKADEVNIISGALKLKRVQISEIMTRIEDVYMLDLNSCLDFDTIQAIIERGYSRIPVHEPGNRKNIVALLFAKDLALLDPDDRTPVQTMISFYNHPIMYVFEDATLDIALDEFKTGKSHMAIVQRVQDDGEKDPIYEITGIVTLEDVIEEIMQMEINDETDTLSDNRRKRRRKEAQVRKDFSQFTNLGSGDSSFNVVTPQLCLAAYQYLATTVEPLTSKFLSDTILKRLLSQKIYYKVRMDDNQAQKRLYTAGEPSDYFIMILEGRVHVVCGKENLVFDGGPFSFFGKAALTMPSDSLITDPSATSIFTRKESSSVKPIDRRESVAGKLSNQFSISMKKLEQMIIDTDNNNTVNLPMTSTDQATNSVNWLAGGDSKASIYSVGQVDKLVTHYLPDYTVEIVTNTSYLKITRNDYLTALKATLVERGSVLTDAETAASSTGNISVSSGNKSTHAADQLATKEPSSTSDEKPT